MKISWSAKQIFISIGILLFIGFLYYLFVRWSFHVEGWFQILLTVLIFFTLITLFKKYYWRLDNFTSGILGESDVGDVLLDDLPEEYIHLCDVNLMGKGNIDYVLIGPTGIWTIEVKSHAGYVDFDGTELIRKGELFEKDFLKQAWAEAFSVRDVLKQKTGETYFVQPVIAFSNPRAKMKFGFNKIKGVYVINRKWLSNLILKEKGTLKVEEIDKIADIIDDYKR